MLVDSLPFELSRGSRRFDPESYQICITSMLCVCVNEETAKDVIELSKRYENVYASLGSHPESAGRFELATGVQRLPQAIAIGEMGLDYKNKRLDAQHTQLQSFEYQMALAGDSKLVIIHTREAEDDTTVLKNFLDLGVCCTASLNLRG